MVLSMLMFLLVLGGSWNGVESFSSVADNIFAPASEVFIMPLTNHDFNLPTADMVRYSASLSLMPDLPSWLHYSYSVVKNTGYIYGVPPIDSQDIQLEVVAIDQRTYDIRYKKYHLEVQHNAYKTFEIQFKINNMNVEDLLSTDHRERLINIFTQELWMKSKDDLVITKLTSALHKGDRLPLDPNAREGVYVGLGSNHNFSQHILEIEKEAEVLYPHRPCPLYFKKVSFENYFIVKNFAIDWCSFIKLVNNKSSDDDMSRSYNSWSKIPTFSALENDEGPVTLQKRSEVESRSYTFDVVHTILVPLIVMMALLGLLTLAMCCHRANMDLQSSYFFDEIFEDFPRMPIPQDIQMVQYASINQATEAALRALKGRDHSPHPSMATTTTQADTIPRSRTGSPASTLPHGAVVKRYEDYATLSRPDPPPYQRNGSTPTR